MYPATANDSHVSVDRRRESAPSCACAACSTQPVCRMYVLCLCVCSTPHRSAGRIRVRKLHQCWIGGETDTTSRRHSVQRPVLPSADGREGIGGGGGGEVVMFFCPSHPMGADLHRLRTRRAGQQNVAVRLSLGEGGRGESGPPGARATDQQHLTSSNYSIDRTTIPWQAETHAQLQYPRVKGHRRPITREKEKSGRKRRKAEPVRYERQQPVSTAGRLASPAGRAGPQPRDRRQSTVICTTVTPCQRGGWVCAPPLLALSLSLWTRRWPRRATQPLREENIVARAPIWFID